MSLLGDMTDRHKNSEQVWKALADGTRRDILDMLAERPQLTGEIVMRFEDRLCRTAVMKHLEILVDANLVIVRREGRSRWNHLNPVPIQRVCDRWVSKHVRRMASSLSRLKDLVEEREPGSARGKTGKRKSGKPKTRKKRNPKK